MDIEKVYQGRQQSFAVNLTDTQGNPYTGFTGTEVLTVNLSAGSDQASHSPAPTAQWLDAPNGKLVVTFAAAVTTGLAVGRYLMELVITPSGQDPISANRSWIDVVATAGSASPLACYSTYQDLLTIYPNLAKFQTEEDQTAFANQRHAGHEYINRTILDRYASWLERQRRSQGYWYDAPRLDKMQSYLNAGNLISDVLSEIEARYAVYLILDTAFNTGKSTDDQYMVVAHQCRDRAYELLDGLRVRVTNVTDGVDFYFDGDVVIQAGLNIF